MRLLEDPAFTPVQQAYIDRIDAAVAIGVVGLAVLLLLVAVLAVRALW